MLKDKAFWFTWLFALLGVTGLFVAELVSLNGLVAAADPQRGAFAALCIAMVFLAPLMFVLVKGAVSQARHERWLRKRYPDEDFTSPTWRPQNDNTDIEYWEVK